jgi:hypothetical protein
MLAKKILILYIDGDPVYRPKGEFAKKGLLEVPYPVPGMTLPTLLMLAKKILV